MSIVAPIAGLSAAVPVAVGIASGDRPSAWKLVGIACALGGVFLASREPASSTGTAATTRLSVLSRVRPVTMPGAACDRSIVGRNSSAEAVVHRIVSFMTTRYCLRVQIAITNHAAISGT